MESSVSCTPPVVMNHVYRTSAEQKAHSRDAAKLYRYGSPKLRDLLRNKCRLRMKEARSSSFELSRNTKSSLNTKFEILREEISELEYDIELQEAIYKELLDEVNDWFIEEQEQEESYIVSTEEANDVICPICQKQTLKCETLADTVTKRYHCNCGISFNYSDDAKMLQSVLVQQINMHGQTCAQPLFFFTEPQARDKQRMQLNVMCDKCDYFNSF